ncbi:2-keto-4-pentenoate hydratase [Bailinhaonella thermotolerans]|uniref:2-keto-4-pentenoate hydratase n=1 Tax=Bailinhaonella thermotolerans TaxID=1070861 RepID=A0A3A4B036_9ACTN|nr:fumarylacetoacetate hydrolase family protein [Bailinhaonella thermotolerans]RJL31397.1 2-keto-4-pentenoate hydratase [Bailinhaonella thermotolerans]
MSIEKAAARLREAAGTRTPCAPVRDLIGTVEEAYAVQRVAVEHGVAEGRRLVGHKIGLTNPAVQAQLGVDTPDFGALFADMAYADGAPIPTGALLQPRAEAEVALVLGRDLPDGPCTVADVIRAADFALPAIEIVDSRVENWDITLVDTVADNASSGLFVLGNRPVRLEDVDLGLAGMVMTRNGREASVGAGVACLGHPLNAALWLANTMAAAGEPLREGEILLTGALGPVVPVEAGDVFEARVAGLGSVRAVFA